MPRASESQNELRCCNCNKCLAVDGEIRCRGCKTDNQIPGYSAASTATHLLAHAFLHDLLDGKEEPTEITIIKGEPNSGLDYYIANPSRRDRVIETREEQKKKIVALLGVNSLVTLLGGPTRFEDYQRISELARKLVENCDGKINDYDAVDQLLNQCQKEAQALAQENLPKAKQAVEALMKRDS